MISLIRLNSIKTKANSPYIIHLGTEHRSCFLYRSWFPYHFWFLVLVPFSFLILTPFSLLVQVPFLGSWFRSCVLVLYFLFLSRWYCSTVPGYSYWVRFLGMVRRFPGTVPVPICTILTYLIPSPRII